MHAILARGVCIQDNKILLAYLRAENYFFLPGGHVEPGESVKAALRREMHEELNIFIETKDVISVFEHSWSTSGEPIYELNFLIGFFIPDNVELVSHIKHLDFKWVGLDEFNSIAFLPKELKRDVESLLNGKNIRFFSSSLE